MSRGEDNRLILPPEFTKFYPPSTDELLEDPDFLPSFHPSIDQNCPTIWTPFNDEMKQLASVGHGQHLHLYPGKPKSEPSNFYSKEVEDEFFKDMIFHQKFLDKAQEVLQKVRKQHLAKSSSKKVKEPIFIGVHWRLTDHLDFQSRFGIKPVKINYFLDAMHLYRKKFKKRAVFVFVSDDMTFGQAKLTPRVKEKDVYFVGNGKGTDKDGIGYDLALLVQCNHTIQSHGTYSYFAGVFANGLRIIPEHFREFRDKSHTNKILDQNPLENPLPRLYRSKDFQEPTQN